MEVEKNIKNVVATRRVPLRGMKAKVEYHGANVPSLDLASKELSRLDEFLPVALRLAALGVGLTGHGSDPIMRGWEIVQKENGAQGRPQIDDSIKSVYYLVSTVPGWLVII